MEKNTISEVVTMPVKFSLPKPFTVGDNSSIDDNPLFLALGDINKNSFLDIVTVSNNEVSVFLGDALANFSSVNSYPVDNEPLSVVLEDINENGFLDVVTVSNNEVSVFLGEALADFSSVKSYPVEDEPLSVVLEDINEDDFLDAVTASSSEITLLLGDGDGNFAISRQLLAENEPLSVALGDIDNNGSLDIVTIGVSSGSVLFGNGNGDSKLFPFNPRQFSSEDNSPSVFPAEQFLLGENSFSENPFSIALGDLDGDDFLDLVIANYYFDDISVLLGDGTGNFGPVKYYDVGARPNSVVIEDIDNDGALDLINTNSGDGKISILLGDGDGNFDPAEYYYVGVDPSLLEDPSFPSLLDDTNSDIGGNPLSVIAGDINKDGLLDLVTANFLSDEFSVLLNTSTPDTEDETLTNDEDIALPPTSSDAPLSLANDIFSTIFIDNGDGFFRYRGKYTGHEQVFLVPQGQ